MTRTAPSGGPVHFTCDDDSGCKNALQTNEREFRDAQEILRMRGWICYPVGHTGTWKHACPECYVDYCSRYGVEPYKRVEDPINLEPYARTEKKRIVTWSPAVYGAVDRHGLRLARRHRPRVKIVHSYGTGYDHEQEEYALDRQERRRSRHNPAY